MPLTKALCPDCLVLVVTQETDFIGKKLFANEQGGYDGAETFTCFCFGFFSSESDFYA